MLRARRRVQFDLGFRDSRIEQHAYRVCTFHRRWWWPTARFPLSLGCAVMVHHEVAAEVAEVMRNCGSSGSPPYTRLCRGQGRGEGGSACRIWAVLLGVRSHTCVHYNTRGSPDCLTVLCASMANGERDPMSYRIRE
jgi:hypothetical protein